MLIELMTYDGSPKVFGLMAKHGDFIVAIPWCLMFVASYFLLVKIKRAIFYIAIWVVVIIASLISLSVVSASMESTRAAGSFGVDIMFWIHLSLSGLLGTVAKMLFLNQPIEERNARMHLIFFGGGLLGIAVLFPLMVFAIIIYLAVLSSIF